VKERRAINRLTLMDFRKEFENQYYSRYPKKNKEQEFLTLTLKDMTISEYEKIERFMDGIIKELYMECRSNK
jgi:hypothetical protein